MKLSALMIAFILIIPFANSNDDFNSPMNGYVIKNTTTVKCYNYLVELSNKADLIYMKIKVKNDFTNGDFITEGPATLMLSSEYGGSVTYTLNNYSLRYTIDKAVFDYFKASHGNEIRNCKVF